MQTIQRINSEKKGMGIISEKKINIEFSANKSGVILKGKHYPYINMLIIKKKNH